MTVCTVHWDTWMHNEYEYICVELGFEQLFYDHYKFLWKCDVSFYVALFYYCDCNVHCSFSFFLCFFFHLCDE